MERPILVKNIDGIENSGGAIIHEVEVNIYFKGHVERVRMDVCNLGKTEVILGIPWLQAHNPEIDWEKGKVKIMRCPSICGQYMGKREMGPEIKKRRKGKKEIQGNKIERIRWTVDEKKDWRREKEIELDYRKVEAMVPQKFHKWLKVFGKVESERMPTRKIWDHMIDLKEEFKTSKARVYPLSRNEREEVQQFVQDHLRKEYIRSLKLPQTSLVFFVEKKNSEKCMIMDYRKLNKQTVKNNYLLPLITNLVNAMGNKKLFTKMDLQWDYNNVCIQEEDEWKAAFTTHIMS